MSPNAVFVYGSLLCDEVVVRLLKRIPPCHAASVRGYSRHAIRQRIYPAVIKAADEQSVTGRVLCELTPEEVEILDDFEAEEYYRAEVEAQLQDGSTVTAGMYVWQDALRSMLHGSWEIEDFRQQHLASFLQMMEQWDIAADFPKPAA